MSREEESKVEWETPPRDGQSVSGRLVAGVVSGAVIIFTFFVVATWAQLQYRLSHLSPREPTVPAELGKAEINIVNQSLFELDTRGYQLRERQQRRLESYGWVDRERGLVHIPIDEAIQRLVEEQRARREGEQR